MVLSLPGGVLEEAEEFGETAVEGKSFDTEATTAGNDVGGPERAVEHRDLIVRMGLTRPIPQARLSGELLESPPVRLAERLRAGAAIEWMPTGEITVEYARSSIQVYLRPRGSTLPVPERDFDFVFHVKKLALRDSNPRLADYEPAVLTAELRALKLRGHVGTGTRGEHWRPGGSEARRLSGSVDQRERGGLGNGRQRGNRTHITRSAAECSVR